MWHNLNMADTAVVRMGPQGRIVVPAELRRELGLDEGSTMTVVVKDGRLILEPRSIVLGRLRERFSGVPLPTDLADELVADRLEEAQLEGTD